MATVITFLTVFAFLFRIQSNVLQRTRTNGTFEIYVNISGSHQSLASASRAAAGEKTEARTRNTRFTTHNLGEQLELLHTHIFVYMYVCVQHRCSLR